jgi:hypothetical protein
MKSNEGNEENDADRMKKGKVRRMSRMKQKIKERIL